MAVLAPVPVADKVVVYEATCVPEVVLLNHTVVLVAVAPILVVVVSVEKEVIIVVRGEVVVIVKGDVVEVVVVTVEVEDVIVIVVTLKVLVSTVVKDVEVEVKVDIVLVPEVEVVVVVESACRNALETPIIGERTNNATNSKASRRFSSVPRRKSKLMSKLPCSRDSLNLHTSISFYRALD